MKEEIWRGEMERSDWSLTHQRVINTQRILLLEKRRIAAFWWGRFDKDTISEIALETSKRKRFYETNKKNILKVYH